MVPRKTQDLLENLLPKVLFVMSCVYLYDFIVPRKTHDTLQNFLPHIAFSFAMAASQKKRLCKGPKLSDHALFGALKNWESCSKFLDDYGANPTLSCSTQRSSNDILSQSFVRLRIPKAQSAGNRDLWLCSACGWVDYTAGCDRALFHKFGGMTKAGCFGTCAKGGFILRPCVFQPFQNAQCW